MSRELDAEIAEQVMGRPSTYVPPPYSTDIAAAWEVVERMRGDFMLTLNDHITYWRASFIRSRGLLRPGLEADTAPLAICRAALAAVKEAQG